MRKQDRRLRGCLGTILKRAVGRLSQKTKFVNLHKALLMMALIWLLDYPANASAGGGWIFYRDGAYHGQVIDAETKQPIEGSVVVAVYTVSCFRFIQTNSREIGVQEVLTKADGTFKIPSFWTITTPECLSDYTWLTVFKPGYGPGPDAFEIYATHFPKKGEEGVMYTGEIVRGWHRAMEDQHYRELKELFQHDLERQMSQKVDEKERQEIQEIHNKSWARYERLYFEGKISETLVPFIPLAKAKDRLSSLDIPFPATHPFPENAKLIDQIFFPPSRLDIEYRVIGLYKLKTKEEWRKQFISSPVSSDRLERKLKVFKKLESEFDEEKRRILSQP